MVQRDCLSRRKQEDEGGDLWDLTSFAWVGKREIERQGQIISHMNLHICPSI